MMFAATGLSVITFYRHPEYANLPVTMQHIGVMIWVFPAALLMQRLGRSIGFRIGSLIGMIGAIVMSVGLYSANFLVMCIGGLILGYSVACLQMYRFAAAELVPLSYRAKAISWVTAGGVAAAVIGPSLTRITHDLVMPLYLATYASILILHVIVFTVMSFIEFPSTKALVEQSQDAAAAEPPRPLSVIASQPRFIASVMAGMLAFGTMSFIMSASPLAIVGCGFPHAEAHWVIFVHVLGMFVPSFFTGNLINRYGTTTIMACGVALMVAGVAVALCRPERMEFPHRAHDQRHRLEFPVRHRDDDRDHLLPPERTRQGAGAERFSGVRHHRDLELHGRLPAGEVGLGAAELVLAGPDPARRHGGDLAARPARDAEAGALNGGLAHGQDRRGAARHLRRGVRCFLHLVEDRVRGRPRAMHVRDRPRDPQDRPRGKIAGAP